MTVLEDVWRCVDEYDPSQTVGDVEQQRLCKLRLKVPELCTQITRFAEGISELIIKQDGSTNRLSLDQVLLKEADALIPSVIADCSHGMLVDDRPIYWGRLLTQYFFKWFNRQSVPRAVARDLCLLHERNSRHYSNKAAHSAPVNKRRVLLTAFDPFLLNANIKQSNPSASVALTLAEMYQDTVPIEVHIFPVRYRDFNEGIVERVLKPRFERDPLLVLTLSMGRDEFDLERFVGRRRSSPVLDNLDYSPVKDGKNPPCLQNSPEFLEFTLPAELLVDVQGPWRVHDNRVVSTQSRGEFEAQDLDELKNEVCVQGSGGGFLSNEVAYRTRLMQLKMNKSFPLGHLHLPKISQFCPDELWQMVQQTSKILDRLLEYVDETTVSV